MVFHIENFYSTTLTPRRVCAFLHISGLDPYIRRFVSASAHSNHRYFIDPRPIGNTIHLWTAFVLIAQLTVTLSRLYRASDIAACRSIRVGVSGRYSIIPPIGLSVLLVRLCPI